MSVPTGAASAVFRWTGVETSFAAAFPFNQATDLIVAYVADAAPGTTARLSLGQHYDVAIDPATRFLTMTPRSAMPAAPGTLALTRFTPSLQTTLFFDGEAVPASAHQQLHDSHVQRTAELQWLYGPFSALMLNWTPGRANTYLGYDANGAASLLAAPQYVVVSGVTVDFPSRAAAVAANVAGGASFLRLAGWLAAGDHGGESALYARAGAAPAHPAYFQSADGAYWVMTNKVVWAEMFGAVGDGVANDAVPLQNAVAYLTAVNGGEIDLIRTYKAVNGVGAVAGANIKITSRGGGGAIYYPQTANSAQHCFTFSGYNQELSRVRIYSDAFLTRNQTGFAVLLQNSDRTLIEACEFDSIATNAVWANGATRARVNNNNISSPKAGGIQFSTGCSNFEAKGNFLYNCTDDALAVVNDSGGARPVNGVIAGNQAATTNLGSGCTLIECDYVEVGGNLFENCNYAGVSNYQYGADVAPATNINIHDNKIINCGNVASATQIVTVGILVRHLIDSEILNNTIVNPGGAAIAPAFAAGIYLDDFRRVRIAGNRISASAAYGVLVPDSAAGLAADLSELLIEDNYFRDIAHDAIRIAPIVAQPGPLAIRGNSFRRCATAGGSFLWNLGNFQNSQIILQNNSADAGGYQIAGCNAVVADDNVPMCLIPFTPNARAGVGAYTTVTSSGLTCNVGGLTYVEGLITIAAAGPGTVLYITLPNAYSTIANAIMGEETVVSGKSIKAGLTGGNFARFTYADNTDPSATGAVVEFAGTYR